MIGGAPTVGKSFTARRLSEELEIPWISTDTIREMMRKIVDRGKYTNLFRFEDEERLAEQYLTTHTPQQIVDNQNKEGSDVWKGVMALIETDYSWKNFIIEGVAILPSLVAQIKIDDCEVKPIFLVDNDKERTRKVVFERGLWDDANKYPDSVKEIEVEWATLFNDFIRKESSKYGYKPYEITDREQLISSLMGELKGWLN